MGIMVRALLASLVCTVTRSEEVSSLLQTRANNEVDCTRKNGCKTTTTTKRSTCADVSCPADMDSKDGATGCRGTCSVSSCCLTTTTTTTPSIGERRAPPPTNCPVPRKAKICHFWGEPHFTSLFVDGKQDRSHETGSRNARHHRHMEFHESGVFLVAEAHGHQVQGFFCPGPGIDVHGNKYSPTSSACGVAIRMADGTDIVMIRSPKTKSRSNKLWTYPNAMSKGDATILDIYVNGVKQDWNNIGGRFRGEAVGSQVSKGQRGQQVGRSETFISKLHSNADIRESGIATAPTCVHDKDQKFLVDVSVPIIKGNWPLVYEMSVTIMASETDGVGLCGDKDTINEVDRGRKGYLNRGSDSSKVQSADVIFTSVQLAQLYDTCGMNPKNGENLVPSNTKDTLCAPTSSYTTDDAEAACKDALQEFESGMDWLDLCIIENCMTHGQSTVPMSADCHDEYQLVRFIVVQVKLN